jgi:methionyl-tRNA synthetase
MKKVLVMGSPPTPNGDLHIGHLAGPYLRSDILTRYLRMRGVDAYFFTGSDEHQSYVAFRAEQLGLDPFEAAEMFDQTISETLEAAQINIDVYSVPRRLPYHSDMVRDLFESLYSRGKLVAKEEPCLYCETCQQYLFEVYVHGKCPHCGANSAGCACETCARPNNCTDLEDPACNRCGQKPGVRRFTRLYFPLSQSEEQLRRYHESAHMSPHMRSVCEQMLAEGLPDIPVTHFTDWGVPVPLPEFAGQCFYVWFEMVAGELAATQDMCERLGLTGGWEQFWTSDQADVVKFFGCDNSYFYGVLAPAVAMTYNPEINPPNIFVNNEFYRLDGLKFSTSRKHAIWGADILKRTSVDALRFYLSYTAPETEQTNFTMNEYESTVQREIVEGFEAWLHDLGDRIAAYSDGLAPAAPVWDREHDQFFSALKRFHDEVAASYEPRSFSNHRAACLLIELVRAARQFGRAVRDEDKRPVTHAKYSTGIALELAAAKSLAILSAPIMPGFAANLWRALGFETPVCWESAPTCVAPGTRIERMTATHFTEAVMV